MLKRQFSAGIIPYIIKNNKRLYLLLHYESGHWDFPKGQIEKGETKHQAAVRELQEEAGISAEMDNDFEESFSYFFRDRDGTLVKKEVYFFVGKANSEKITLSFEHQDYAWLEFENAITQLTYKNAKELLTQANIFLQKTS